jgi:hypothetical protein
MPDRFFRLIGTDIIDIWPTLYADIGIYTIEIEIADGASSSLTSFELIIEM